MRFNGKVAKSVVALMAVSALALTGCGRQDSSSSSSASGSANKTIRVGVSLPQKTSENWVLAENLFNQDLKDAGYQGTVQFANGGASEQQNQISAMVQKGVDVLIVGAVDSKQLGSQLKQAKDSGATVIAYDRLLENTPNVDYFVAYDNYKVGQLQAEALLKGMEAKKPKGPYNIELFAGAPTDGNSAMFFNGAMSVLKPKIDDGTLKVVSGQTTQQQAATQDWKPENAQKRMDTILSGSYQNTELDGVLSPNDTLARAIITSVKSAGKPIPVVTGQDSEVESVKSIMAGEQYSTINKDTRALVEQAVKMAGEAAKGEKVDVNDAKGYNNGVKDVPAYLLQPVIVTKENAAEAYANDPTLSKLTK